MRELCEVCGQREHVALCDYATGTGVVTSVHFQELTATCDKKICTECSTRLWANCDVCPEHAETVRERLSRKISG